MKTLNLLLLGCAAFAIPSLTTRNITARQPPDCEKEPLTSTACDRFEARRDFISDAYKTLSKNTLDLVDHAQRYPATWELPKPDTWMGVKYRLINVEIEWMCKDSSTIKCASMDFIYMPNCTLTPFSSITCLHYRASLNDLIHSYFNHSAAYPVLLKSAKGENSWRYTRAELTHAGIIKDRAFALPAVFKRYQTSEELEAVIKRGRNHIDSPGCASEPLVSRNCTDWVARRWDVKKSYQAHSKDALDAVEKARGYSSTWETLNGDPGVESELLGVERLEWCEDPAHQSECEATSGHIIKPDCDVHPFDSVTCPRYRTLVDDLIKSYRNHSVSYSTSLDAARLGKAWMQTRSELIRANVIKDGCDFSQLVRKDCPKNQFQTLKVLKAYQNHHKDLLDILDDARKYPASWEGNDGIEKRILNAEFDEFCKQRAPYCDSVDFLPPEPNCSAEPQYMSITCPGYRSSIKELIEAHKGNAKDFARLLDVALKQNSWKQASVELYKAEILPSLTIIAGIDRYFSGLDWSHN